MKKKLFNRTTGKKITLVKKDYPPVTNIRRVATKKRKSDKA